LTTSHTVNQENISKEPHCEDFPIFQFTRANRKHLSGYSAEKKKKKRKELSAKPAICIINK